MRVVIHDQLDERASFAVLCHELAHIYLGHLGGDKKGRWPSRLNLTHTAVELEAESAAYITCTRLGITPSSERYLSGYLKNDKVISLVSIEMIVKVAGKLEGMARHLQPDRQAKQAPPERP
jgi:antirestriction protein ArdC